MDFNKVTPHAHAFGIPELNRYLAMDFNKVRSDFNGWIYPNM